MSSSGRSGSTFEAAVEKQSELDPALKQGAHDAMDKYIAKNNLVEVSSTDAGRKFFQSKLGKEWKSECGALAAACFGVFLKDYFEQKPGWDGPVKIDRDGRTHTTYRKRSR